MIKEKKTNSKKSIISTFLLWENKTIGSLKNKKNYFLVLRERDSKSDTEFTNIIHYTLQFNSVMGLIGLRIIGKFDQYHLKMG
jgi:hypothetical protein